jgi:transcriptional regulator with XRE-family HTH domain
MKIEAEQFYKYVGARMKAVREMRKMSQEEVARALGVTFQQVQKYETGANNPPLHRLVMFLLKAGIGMPELLGDYYLQWGKATDMRDLTLVSFLKSRPAAEKKALADALAKIAKYFG